MKILVCGSRKWTNRKAIVRELAKLPPGTILVHGACPKGADIITDEEAKKMGHFTIRPYPAPWEEYAAAGNPKAAGPVRNSQMIREEHPDVFGAPIDRGLAFTENLDRSRGTKDMVLKLRKAGIKVDIISA